MIMKNLFILIMFLAAMWGLCSLISPQDTVGERIHTIQNSKFTTDQKIELISKVIEASKKDSIAERIEAIPVYSITAKDSVELIKEIIKNGNSKELEK